MRKHYEDWPLSRKLVLIPLLTLLLMGAGLSLAAGIAIQNSYEEKVRRVTQQTVEESGRYVSAELRNIVTLVHYSLLDEGLQGALRTIPDGDIARTVQAEDTIMSTLGQLNSQNTLIHSALLMKGDTVYSDGLHRAEYEMQPLIRAAGESGLSYWSDAVVTDARSGRSLLPFVMRVPTGDFNTRNEAYILINLDADKLFSYIHELETGLDCALILHSGDHVLYDRLGQYGQLDEHTQKVSDIRLETGDWSLLCVIDRSTLYAARNQALLAMFAVALAITALCLFLSYRTAQGLLVRLQNLTSAADRVALGDYEVRTDVTGGDELGKLGQTFNHMVGQISRNVEELEEKNREIERTEGQKRQAEMRVLQAQINPHFLYNTLDSLYWYALSGRKEDVGTLIEKLSGRLHIGLSKGSEYIPVEKEVQHVSDYLAIEKIIFGDKFDYEIRTEGLGGQEVLKILLQPLAENAINHGFENMETGGKLLVEAKGEPEGTLLLRVTDNGCGFPAADEKKENGREDAGFALGNIRQRLQMHYGERASLSVESVPYEHTSVEIRIC